MNELLKISGKKIKLRSEPKQKWSLKSHPGGWIVAQAEDGTRKKLMMVERRNRWSASLGGHLYSGEWIIQSREIAGPESDADLVAQFPGKIRKILVQEESFVQEGDSLLLVEAMKMEFTVRSPFAGRVSRILVAVNQQVLPGDRFLDLEAIPSGE